MMTRALQVINEHSQLRASTADDDIVIDEVETKHQINVHDLLKKTTGKNILR